MKIIEYSVKNPLLVNILMIAIFILGTISLIELPRELNPKIVFNWMFVIVPYPGVGAEEVEKLITVKIEDEIDDVEDIKMLTSESSEGSGFVSIKFEDISESEYRERKNEIESKVNGINFPEDALDPMYMELSSDEFIPVISVSIAGDMPERELHRITERLKDDIMDLEGVAKVAQSGTREREIWVEVDQSKLYQHRTSLSQIVQSLSGRNLNIPAGEMNIGNEAYLVRTIGEVETVDEIEKIVVRWNPNGNHLYLGQIAEVKDGWEREATRSRMDGNPASTLSISKGAKANSLDVIEQVKEVARKYQHELPLNSKIVFTNDNGIYIKDILGKLQANAILGFALVILLLYIFMGFRNALVAAIGIPIAFMAAFIFMRQTGQTFNGSSLFGLMLVLGVVVDDAIIVVENCFRRRQMGESPMQASINGASEVFWPVISATLTTIAAFLPLMLMTGIIGKFMRVIPIIVSMTLLASMVEVFLIAPSHFAEWGGKKAHGSDRWFRNLRRIYTHVLIWLVRRRYLVGPFIFILMAVMGALIPFVGVELFRGDEFSQFYIYATMPPGSRLEDTDRVISKMEEIALQMPKEEIHTVIANAGLMQTEDDWIFADHVGQVVVDLVEKGLRDREMDEIMNEIREKVEKIPGPIKIEIKKMSGGPPVGKPVEVKVKGKYLDELQVVAAEVEDALRTTPGVYDVGNDYWTGKKEIKIVVDEPRAAYYGLNAAMIATEVRNAVEGNEATIFRDGDEEVDVRVKLKGGNDMGVEGLRNINILTPTGQLVRLDNICDFVEAPTLFRIKRFEKERAITVSANIDNQTTSVVEVNSKIIEQFKDISVKYPGYRLDFRGEFQEFKEAFNDLGRLFLFGILLIFTILGAQFKSVRQAFIILMTIPFAFIGSMLGLIISGNPFSILTMYAMVALAGIAVNDAIVLISFINNKRRRNGGRWRSIIESGHVRLRPVILTSLTTILGLTPMAIGLGGKSETWGPFATTIIWGLVVATMMTLFAIPTIYSIVVDDWFGWLPVKRRFFKREREE